MYFSPFLLLSATKTPDDAWEGQAQADWEAETEEACVTGMSSSRSGRGSMATGRDVGVDSLHRSQSEVTVCCAVPMGKAPGCSEAEDTSSRGVSARIFVGVSAGIQGRQAMQFRVG